MNIIRIDKNNQVNGPGLRCVVWVSGCNHYCKNCHNPETWDEKVGHEFCEDDWQTIVNQLNSKEISGITLTGGDPFYPNNRADLVALCKRIKQQYPNKTIWCYTGYNFEDVYMDPLMENIDVLVDGIYDEKLNPGVGKCKWRGSSNQRVLDIQRTINEGRITEYVEINGKTISENER